MQNGHFSKKYKIIEGISGSYKHFAGERSQLIKGQVIASRILVVEGRKYLPDVQRFCILLSTVLQKIPESDVNY